MAQRLLLLNLLVVSTVLQAQESPLRKPLDGPLRIDAGPALQRVDGELWGAGPDYKARFDAAGVEFTPRLGAGASHNLPLQFELSSVGRGAEPIFVAAVPPQSQGLRVTYAREGFVERYDVGADAVEQSFRFDVLPPGDGDLVVRGRLRTGLRVERDGDGYSLHAPDGGGLNIGGVTGIDAVGRRSPGTLFIDGDRIELTLPAAFVSSATLPLVLDPRIAPFSNRTVSGANGDGDPSVAYDATSRRYLVVFQRLMSASDGDIIRQLVSGTGDLLGSPILIQVSAALNDRQPSVGNVNARDGFVVAYQRGSTSRDILARGVLATGIVRNEIAVASSANDERDVQVSGESSPSYFISHGQEFFPSNAQCFWINWESRTVVGRIVTMAATGDLSTPSAAVTVIPSDSRFVQEIAAPKSSGTPRALVPIGDVGAIRLVVARRSTLSTHTTGRLDFQAVSGNLAPIGPVLSPDPSFSTDREPRIDGNGRTWVCSWTQSLDENPLGSGVLARSFTFDGVAISPNTGRITVEDDVNDREHMSAVGWLGDGSCVIPFRDDRVDGGYEIYSASVDLFGCTPCEPTGLEDLVAGAGNSVTGMDVATTLSGGSTAAEEGLTVWGWSFGASSAVLGVLWRAEDGDSRSIGGSCGSGGTAHGTCARPGNPDFAFRLRQSVPAASSFLVLSPTSRNLGCGTCNLVPDPFVGLVLAAGNTSAVGAANLPVSIFSSTSLSGVELLAQWIVLDTVSPPCGTLDAHFSNAIRVTIQ
jgi:hypothetical protein